MSMSRHEQNLAVATAFVVAFGLLGLKLRDGLDGWRESLSRLDALRRQRAEARELIDAGPQWRAQYEKVRSEMPVFEPGRQVDTYWMSEMDRLAREHSVSITRRQVGRETLVGDVYEFSTECQWEAPLDAFVRFLHAMQSAGAMLDVRELVIRTQDRKKGFLRGNFTLHCAYMRGETEGPEATETPDSPASHASPETETQESRNPETPEAEIPGIREPGKPDSPAPGNRETENQP